MIRKLQAFPSVRGATFAVGVFVALVLGLAAEKTASAQGAPGTHFGNQGQLAVTAENLFGFSLERTGVDQPNDTETSTTSTNFGLFHRSTANRGPWVGAHYFVIPNLSIGATLAFVLGGGSRTSTSNGTTTTRDSPSSFSFLVIPKVGYALMLTDMLGFWFRAGPAFTRTSSSGPDDDDPTSASSFWFVSLDALFIVAPVPHFGFYVGPQGNLSFAGSVSSTNNMGTTTSWDANFRSFSIDAGLLGTFDL